MDIIIQSLGFTAGESLESFIKDKVSSLKSDEIVRANVTLFNGPSGNPDSNYCEIRLEIPGNDLFVKKSSPHFETAVNECVDVLHLSLKKTKGKTQGRRQADAEQIQDIINESDDN